MHQPLSSYWKNCGFRKRCLLSKACSGQGTHSVAVVYRTDNCNNLTLTQIMGIRRHKNQGACILNSVMSDLECLEKFRAAVHLQKTAVGNPDLNYCIMYSA